MFSTDYFVSSLPINDQSAAYVATHAANAANAVYASGNNNNNNNLGSNSPLDNMDLNLDLDIEFPGDDIVGSSSSSASSSTSSSSIAAVAAASATTPGVPALDLAGAIDPRKLRLDLMPASYFTESSGLFSPPLTASQTEPLTWPQLFTPLQNSPIFDGDTSNDTSPILENVSVMDYNTNNQYYKFDTKLDQNSIALQAAQIMQQQLLDIDLSSNNHHNHNQSQTQSHNHFSPMHNNSNVPSPQTHLFQTQTLQTLQALHNSIKDPIQCIPRKSVHAIVPTTPDSDRPLDDSDADIDLDIEIENYNDNTSPYESPRSESPLASEAETIRHMAESERLRIIKKTVSSKWVKLSPMNPERSRRVRLLAQNKGIALDSIDAVLKLYADKQRRIDNKVTRFYGDDVFIRISMGTSSVTGCNPNYDAAADADDDMKHSPRSKRSRSYVKRPLNSFMIYRKSQTQSSVACAMATVLKLNHKSISQIIGLLWQTESQLVKDEFAQFAKEEKEIHRALHPDYKFSPRKKKTVVSSSSIDN